MEIKGRVFHPKFRNYFDTFWNYFLKLFSIFDFLPCFVTLLNYFKKGHKNGEMLFIIFKNILFFGFQKLFYFELFFKNYFQILISYRVLWPKWFILILITKMVSYFRIVWIFKKFLFLKIIFENYFLFFKF